MKNTLLIVLILVVIGGIGGYFALNKKSSTVVAPAETQKQELSAEENGVALGESRYISFSPEVLANSADTRRVLFFYANWCPTCKPADESFTKNVAQIPDDVTLIRVNYNDTQTDQAEKDLAKKYGITYQHTFVQIDAQGNEITKWNGGQIEELLENIE